MHRSIPFVLLGMLLLATPATAKKRPIELDPGLFRWDSFSYSELPAAVKAQVNATTVVNRHGGSLIQHDDVVLEYDGDSTQTVTRSLRVVNMERLILLQKRSIVTSVYTLNF